MLDIGFNEILIAIGVWAVIIFLVVRWYKKHRAIKEFEKWFGEKPEKNQDLHYAHTQVIKAKIVPLANEFHRADIAERQVKDRMPYGNRPNQREAANFYSNLSTAQADLELRKSNFRRAVNSAVHFGYIIPTKLEDYLI